jgi:hypothetical protein
MTPDGSNTQAVEGLSQHRTMIRQLLPGVILPGLIYFLVSRRAPVLVALACASSVPALDALVRALRGKRPTVIGLVFVGFAGISVGLAVALRSPMFILAKGAVMSGGMGLAFAVSAFIRRPLTRTLAIMLAAEHVVARRLLNERWRHPKALAIFSTLSMGWGILLLLSALQQTLMVLTVSPGTVMAAEPAVQATVTILGTVASILYVRRFQRFHPEVVLLPQRAR